MILAEQRLTQELPLLRETGVEAFLRDLSFFRGGRDLICVGGKHGQISFRTKRRKVVRFLVPVSLDSIDAT